MIVSIWYHYLAILFIRYWGTYILIWTGLAFTFDFMTTLIDDSIAHVNCIRFLRPLISRINYFLV